MLPCDIIDQSLNVNPMENFVVVLLLHAASVCLLVWLLIKLLTLPKQFSLMVQSALSQPLNTFEQQISQKMQAEIAAMKDQQNHQIQQLFDSHLKSQSSQNETLERWLHNLREQQNTSTQSLQATLNDNHAKQHKQLHDILMHTTSQLQNQFQQLTAATERHMVTINQSMENHLNKGFEKTNETFTNIIKRLAMIDDAQKKITDLSENVVSLQAILHDKRTRGIFGEIQLKALIENVLPENCYSFQYSLSNGLRADCVLFLPDPTGNVIIDAKFPLENYRKLTSVDETLTNRTEVLRAFKQDIKKHIQDISEKYILPPETSDGALMFIPAEAIFAEIHAYHPELVEYAYQKKVWMASPSTLMAILTTAQSVLKDHATKQQIHIIQRHLKFLAKDFSRFEKRMDNLSKHLQQANTDAEQVHTSAKKITRHFSLIENVDLDDSVLSQSYLESLESEES